MKAVEHGRGAQPQGAKGRALARLGLTLVVTVAASLAPGSGALGATSAPTFARADYPIFGNNYVVGDFNGDGSLDLAGTGGSSAAVRLNNGAGTFGPRADYAVGGPGQDLTAGDFNADGRVDLVVTINDPLIGLSLLTGNGDGTFDAPVTFPNTSGFDSPAVAAVDLNNDDKLDVVVAHEIACYTAPCVASELISVVIGNGDGTFQPSREMQVGRGMAEIAVGDYNRDGFKDLALAGVQGQVYRLYGVGDGTFVQQPTLIAVVDQSFIPVTDIDVADFNGDSIQDLAAAVPHNGSRTAILIGNADGTFRAPLVLTDPGLRLPQQQAVADYNGDGFQDLALSLGDGNQGVMQIRNGNGDGTFQAPVQYLVPPPTSSLGGIFIVSANLNADARPDIAINIGGAFPSFAVLLNTTGAAPPPTPSAPTLLSPAQGATPAQPVAFDWTDVTAATAYRIQVDDSNSFSAPLVVDRIVTPSQFTASTPLIAGQRYFWRVAGINAGGTAGPWSSVRRFTAGTFTQAASLAGITLHPASVVGGDTSQGTASLTSAAPSGGAVVTLSSSNASAATVPASVTVPAGAVSATFVVSTASVTASTSLTISGAFGGTARSATLTVTPPPAPPPPASLSTLSLNPASLTGGTSAQGTVALTSAAPAGGFVVSLSSSDTAVASVPGSVSVAQGATSATFAIPTTAVTTSTPVTITASAGGTTRTAILTVNPPPQTATVTVTAMGRSGERVASTPTGISVAVGSTGSASFIVGTEITLRATNERDVIWSGACSSGGNKTKTCTFTLTGNASVTANVQ